MFMLIPAGGKSMAYCDTFTAGERSAGVIRLKLTWGKTCSFTGYRRVRPGERGAQATQGKVLYLAFEDRLTAD